MARKSYKQKQQAEILRLSLFILAISVALIAGMYTVKQYDYVGQVLGSMTGSYKKETCEEQLEKCRGKRILKCARLEAECGK